MSINLDRRRVTAGIVLVATGVIGPRTFAQPADEVVRIVATKYVFTPSEIHLKKGVPAVLELTSADVPMGFSAPEFGVRTDMIPGVIARVRIVPARAGTFDFICDVFCGSGHEDMSGTIIVT